MDKIVAYIAIENMGHENIRAANVGTVAYIADGSDLWKPRIYTDPLPYNAFLHIALIPIYFFAGQSKHLKNHSREYVTLFCDPELPSLEAEIVLDVLIYINQFFLTCCEIYQWIRRIESGELLWKRDRISSLWILQSSPSQKGKIRMN